MYTIQILIIFLFGFSSHMIPQQIIEQKVKRGLDAIYNFEWDKGKKIFNQLIETYPENPAGYHYASIMPMWYYLGSYNSDYLDTFFIFSDLALEYAKQAESEDSLTAELAYLIGSIYANRSIVNARAENYVYAVWESDRMKYYSNLALELDETLIDASLGIALYHLAVSQIPSSLQWAVQLVGVNADRESGLEHLRKVIEKGKLSSVDAKFYLSQIYTRIVIDYKSAKKLLDDLTARYPKNLLFRMSLAWIETENGNIKSAFNKFASIIKSDEENFPILKSFSHYQIGNIYFYQNQFDSAAVHYKEYLESNTRSDYNGIVNYNLGLTYDLLGERDSAIVYYENAGTGNLDLDEDSYARRKGGSMIEDSLGADDIRLIRFKNLFYSGKYKTAIDSLLLLQDDSLYSDLKAESLLFLSKSHLKLKKYREAINYAVKTVQCEIENEKWTQPLALYLSAEASYNLKDYLDAQLFLNLITDYSDYDFSLKLGGLVASLSDKLKKVNSRINK